MFHAARFGTDAVKVNSSPSPSLIITTDSPLISTSSAEVQRALINVGSTIFPNFV